MQTCSIVRFGDADGLALLDRPEPVAGPGEVSIAVDFAGVNYAEVLFRRGIIPDLPLPFTPGLEVAGRVKAVGAGVSDFRVGQRVAALTVVAQGGYAEVVVAPAALVVPVPHVLDLCVAAGVPSNGTTALMVMRDVARIAPGETVVVHAAAGGVGSLLGQVARSLGAGRVIGVVGSERKVEYARTLGYDDVVLSATFAEDIATRTGGRGVDVVVDQVGGAGRRASLDMLRPMGRLIVMGNSSGADDVPLSPNELWLSSKGVLGYQLRLMSETDPFRVRGAFAEALSLIATGTVRLDVTDVLPLSAAPDAHRRIEQRATTGKLVLRVGG
jgi:NADPH:quinone reductase